MKAIRLLLIDDSVADTELTRETLETNRMHVEIQSALDGAEALEKLRDAHASNRLPDLILLDLNMPRMDGREFLSELRKNEALRLIPVVILTSSDAEQDVVKSYKLGANCYATKPVGLSEFQSIVRSISDFWLTVVKLP